MATLERVFSLPPFSELRVLTSSVPGEDTRVVLQTPLRNEADDESASLPRADVFGAELVPGLAVHLPMARSVSVFTPTGCELTVTAPPAVLQRCYATSQGAVWMRSLLGLHSHLEAQRANAKSTGTEAGPRVLVVSDQRYAGTSTYVRMLSAYAVRLGYHPLVLDGAVEHPQFGFPGCLSLFHMQYAFDVEEESLFFPAVHVYAGGNRKTSQEGLYLLGIRELANLGMEKMARSERCRVGGLFVDYGVIPQAAIDAAEVDSERRKRAASDGSTGSSGHTVVTNPIDLLLDTIVEADIDHVFVVQSAWLRFKIAQRAFERFLSKSDTDTESVRAAPPEIVCPDEGIAFKLFLIDGLDYVNTYVPRQVRHQRWMQYFFGTPTSTVKPTLVRLDTASLRIASVGSSKQSAMSTLMPMMDEGTPGAFGDGTDTLGSSAGRKIDPAAITFVKVQDVELKGRILGISSATESEPLPDGSLQRVPYAEFEKRVRECVLIGFALVESVTPEKITLLLNDVPLRKELGLCLVLTEEFLVKQA